MKWITVFADASFDRGFAAYAFFVRNDVRIERRVHPYRIHPCPSSSDAELMAMYHALAFAITQFPHQGGDRISAQTDCLDVIHRFTQPSRRSPGEANLLHYIHSQGVGIDWKHIKAHTAFDDRRSYVNRWCDIEARKLMRKLRGEL